MKHTLLFATIASVLIINSVFAEPKIITTQNYVDAKDALKQNKIDATDTEEFPAGSIVETTEEDGVVAQRGICDGDLYEDGDCGDNYLVTSDALSTFADQIDNQISEATNMPQTTVTTKTCVAWLEGWEPVDSNCLLWNLSDKSVYGPECRWSSDCAEYGIQHNCQYGGYCNTQTGRCDGCLSPS